ncbi:MAG: hypothetical protein Q6373_003115 [Candidatus Sigynarchaeota archaeon]
MKWENMVIIAFRVLLAVFIVPALLSMKAFGQFFELMLRRALKKVDLDDLQRTLNWRGVKGVFEIAWDEGSCGNDDRRGKIRRTGPYTKHAMFNRLV